jgi:hypothetical protein
MVSTGEVRLIVMCRTTEQSFRVGRADVGFGSRDDGACGKDAAGLVTER